MQPTLVQRSLLSTTQLSLEYNGLKVREKGFNKNLEFLVAFENIPSSSLFVRRSRRDAILLCMFFGVVAAIFILAQLSPQSSFTQPNGVIVTALCILIPALILWFTRQEWIGFGMPGNGVMFPANKPSRQAVQAFLAQIQEAKVRYLREVYLDNAGSGTPEEELRRLIWLKDHGVISQEELESRKQKLAPHASGGSIGFRGR